MSGSSPKKINDRLFRLGNLFEFHARRSKYTPKNDILQLIFIYWQLVSIFVFKFLQTAIDWNWEKITYFLWNFLPHFQFAYIRLQICEWKKSISGMVGHISHEFGEVVRIMCVCVCVFYCVLWHSKANENWNNAANTKLNYLFVCECVRWIMRLHKVRCSWLNAFTCGIMCFLFQASQNIYYSTRYLCNYSSWHVAICRWRHSIISFFLCDSSPVRSIATHIRHYNLNIYLCTACME